ncbi:unnamed protein product [Phytophthora fragariaefolia]|uniref:Unnamed protein product n=1 Tax=Phytophthora fragariaefolia TaxID=1490495 RepID=A0A9W6X1F3_9STRA|nr:unnamed protein product [Phytophthora fragariaefolia]
MIRIRREHRRSHGAAELSSDVGINTDDADLVDADADDIPSAKANKPSSLRNLTLSLSRPKEPITDDSYDDIELGVMPRSARAS